VVIAGNRASDDAKALGDVIRGRYLPTAITLQVDEANRERLSRLLPWIAAMTERDGRAAAYVCRDFSCQAPTTDREDLDRQLRFEIE
jgi:uncharacterized protein YyaL (SSP411 family)